MPCPALPCPLTPLSSLPSHPAHLSPLLSSPIISHLNFPSLPSSLLTYCPAGLPWERVRSALQWLYSRGLVSFDTADACKYCTALHCTVLYFYSASRHYTVQCYSLEERGTDNTLLTSHQTSNTVIHHQLSVILCPQPSYQLLYFLILPSLYTILLLAVSGMEGEEEEVDFNEAFKGVEIVDLRE
jgi:hypothetical protein